jgi:type II secretory pathway pseudopilin PulG
MLVQLLVVVSIIAILSAGALLAYEGLTDKAQAATASNNTATADQSIRNYRAVTQAYPNQWDNLLVATGVEEDGTTAIALAGAGAVGDLPDFFNADEADWFSNYAVPGAGATPTAGSVAEKLKTAFGAVGVEELQIRNQVETTADVEPNLQHNEGAVLQSGATTGVGESLFSAVSNIAIVPSDDGTTCSIAGAATPTIYANGTAIGTEAANRLNKINDNLETGECHFVVAFGFGHDAAHSTNDSSVAIATPPTFISQNINPNENYARYVALFHVGSDGVNGGAEDDDITVAEMFDKPRLLAVLDTEGNVIAENVSNANDATQN